MVLSFSQILNGSPTYFIDKIWYGLYLNNKKPLEEYRIYSKHYFNTFHKNWDSKLWKDTPYRPKITTIRALRRTKTGEIAKKQWKAGDYIHPAVNNRSKDYFQFAPTLDCIRVQDIIIIRNSDYLNETIVKVDGRKLKQDEVQQLAWNDGFNNLVEFWMLFATEKNNYEYKGKIIHWTDFKY